MRNSLRITPLSFSAEDSLHCTETEIHLSADDAQTVAISAERVNQLRLLRGVALSSPTKIAASCATVCD